MTTYNVGVIGCGRIASLLEQEPERGTPNTHAGCYDHCDRTRIIAGADANDERRLAFGQRWDVSTMYVDWQEMLKRESLDIVSVCTYPVPHRDMVVAAAESGVKAIFCEKSMAVTLRQADEMIDVCEKHGVRLSINHGRRWDWQYRKIKELLDQKTIGDLVGVSLNYTAGLANNGTHYFDVLRYFGGEVEWAIGRLQDPNALDPKGNGLFHFRSGIDAVVNGISGSNARYLFELIGSAGRIAVTNERGPSFELLMDGKELPFPEVPEDQKLNTFGSGRCVIPGSVEAIVESLDKDEDTVSTGLDGRSALEMVISFHQSESRGNARVNFPLEDRDTRVLVKEADFMSGAVPQ
jgi:predicted dehydrogenase